MTIWILITLTLMTRSTKAGKNVFLDYKYYKITDIVSSVVKYFNLTHTTNNCCYRNCNIYQVMSMKYVYVDYVHIQSKT